MADRPAALRPMLASGEAHFYQPLAQFLSAGIRVTFGSDAPVGLPGPWSGIRGAVERAAGASHFPGERLHFDEALRCAVQAPELVDAWASDWLGRRADLAVLDPSADAPMDGSSVRATIAGGQLFHLNVQGVQPCV